VTVEQDVPRTSKRRLEDDVQHEVNLPKKIKSPRVQPEVVKIESDNEEASLNQSVSKLANTLRSQTTYRSIADGTTTNDLHQSTVSIDKSENSQDKPRETGSTMREYLAILSASRKMTVREVF